MAALADTVAISKHNAQDNPGAQRRSLMNSIYAASDVACTAALIFNRVTEAGVEVLLVLHGAHHYGTILFSDD